MQRPCWRPLVLLKLLLLAQPIFAQLAPREPLSAVVALQRHRLFGPAPPAATAAAASKPPKNHVNADEVRAAVAQFVDGMYDASALTPRATAARPHPRPIPKAAVVAAAHRAALRVLSRHASAHACHPFHSPKPLLAPAFHGDPCAALLVARGLARTAGHARAAALLGARLQAACPVGYSAHFTANLCAARPALRATSYCAAAAEPAPGCGGARRLAGWWSDWDWPTW